MRKGARRSIDKANGRKNCGGVMTGFGPGKSRISFGLSLRLCISYSELSRFVIFNYNSSIDIMSNIKDIYR